MAEQHMLTIISDIPILYNKRNNIILLWRKVGLNHIWTFSLTNLKDDISLWIAALADSPDIAVPGFRETERETPRERERERESNINQLRIRLRWKWNLPLFINKSID